MDFDETCCYIDAIDDLASYYVQETWMKDELSNLLKDEPPD